MPLLKTKSYFQFDVKAEAEAFSSAGYPVEGVDIGDGIHVPKEQSRTLRASDVVEDMKTGKFLVVDNEHISAKDPSRIVELQFEEVDIKMGSAAK